MAEIDDNNESSAKQIGRTALGLKEVRVVLEPLNLERLSQSRSSHSSSFSASEVMGKFPSFNRRHSMGSSSQRRSPGDICSTPSVSGYCRRTPASSQGCSSQRSSRSLRLRSPPRVRMPLSQAIVISDSDDEFQKSKICRVSSRVKKHKRKVKETRRRKERDDSGDRENRKDEHLGGIRVKSKYRRTTIQIKSECSSDEETSQRSADKSCEFKIDLTESPEKQVGNVVDLTEESPEKALEEFVVFNREKSTAQVDSELLKTTDSNENVFSQIQTATEMNESREIKKEMMDVAKEEGEGTFFLNVNGVKCDGTKDLPVFETLENGSHEKGLEKDEIEDALIQVGCEQEEYISKANHTTPLKKLHSIFGDDNSVDSVKKRSCSKRLFDDKEPEEPRKGDLKFVYKLNRDGLAIKKRGRKKKSEIVTEEKKGQETDEEVEEKSDDESIKSEIKNKEKEEPKVELNNSVEDERSDDAPSMSMPTLDCYDQLEPTSPTPRLLPKIIEVQKLDEPNLLDLNRLASPIPTPSRCQGNPDFDAEELYNMVSNEGSLNDESDLAGESLLPIEPATIPTNLDVVDIVEMIQSETIANEEHVNENNVSHFSVIAREKTDEFREKQPGLKKRKIGPEKGAFESDDKKCKLDRGNCSKLADSNYQTFNSREGVKASKTLSLNGDYDDLWIHDAATQVIDIHEKQTQVNANCNGEKKTKPTNDATLEKPRKNIGTTINDSNDTDLDYSSYSSSSSDEEDEKKDEGLINKGKENGDENIDVDDETQEKDKESEDTKNAEQDDEELGDKEEEGDNTKSDKQDDEDLDDCISIFYSDDEQLLKSPERKVSSKYQIPKSRVDPKPKPKYEPKPEAKTQSERVRKVPKLVIKQSGSKSKYECMVKDPKPDTPTDEVPKRKHSPIIFNKSEVTDTKVNVKNSSNIQTAPKLLRFPPQQNRAVSRPAPRPKVQVSIPPNGFAAPPNTFSAPPNTFSAPLNAFTVQPNTFPVLQNVQNFPPQTFSVPPPNILQPLATNVYMLKEFEKDMARTDCNGNQSLFSEPINLRESGQAMNGVFPPAHPTNEYRPPGFTRHCSVQQLINTCSKDEVPSSFSPSKILKPLSDVKMRLGHSGLDKDKVFAKMCFQYLRNGKCPKGTHCQWQHDLTSHREALLTHSRDYLFSVIQLVIDDRLEFYLRFVYARFMEVLDYKDACEMFKLINSRNVVQTRAEVDTILTTMLKKRNSGLSNILLDLTRFVEDPQLKSVLFETARLKMDRPGLFWETFKDYFKESNTTPSKFYIDTIIEDCVLLKKNCAHVTDVCQYFYHLKYDQNVPFDISGVYFERFINLVRKHGLNNYLEVFNVQDDDLLSPMSPNKVQVCVPPVQDPRVHLETSRPIPIRKKLSEAKEKPDEQMQIDDKTEEWKFKLIAIESSELKSAYHDMFGELHQDIFWLTRALKVHDYVKAIDILKKYALDLGKNPFYNTCYNKCLKAITQVGKIFVEQGQVEHEKEFWSFVKDLLDVRYRIEVQDYFAALAVFKKYARSSCEDMRHRFSYVSYLLIREEFTMVEKYFKMIELAGKEFCDQHFSFFYTKNLL